MRIVIDMQGAQTTGSRNRGIGRYTLSLVQAIIKNRRQHDVILALNSLFPDTIAPIRQNFKELIPQNNIRIWHAPGPCHYLDPTNTWRRQTAELVREAFLASLKPSVVLVTSLFEGLIDDAVTSIGCLSQTIPTTVILYDLIPLINRDPYLTNPIISEWYENKLGHLRRMDLLLSISESTRLESIQHLGIPPEQVINLSTAAEPHFAVQEIDASTESKLRNRYGLKRNYLMYTGGIDHRKNIEGLIRSYASLPADLRQQHQLVVVCAIQQPDRDRLMALAKNNGMAQDELVLTDYVSDEDLLTLYNLCKCFVFPSWHEGFGLPALEAMACGKAVIGSNRSSLPEVIGRTDALFDPFDDRSITNKLIQVLTDNAFRKDLERHGLEQAKKFSWDKSAQLAISALEAFDVLRNSATDRSCIPPRRPRLAYISPLPPERSGIADYSAELLPELSRHYNIEVIVAQEVITTPWIRANCPIRTVDWFRTHAAEFDRVLYHFGNSVFHLHMFDLLKMVPGIVVLHDFFLSGIISHFEYCNIKPSYWSKILYEAHGYTALHQRFHADDTTDVIWKYPCNLEVLQNAQGIIVHSEHSRRLAHQWYGNPVGNDWICIPHLRVPVFESNHERVCAREILGLKPNDFMVCSFGMLGPTKLNHRLLDAWLSSPLAQDERCILVFVGENEGGHYGDEMLRRIKRANTDRRIRITGWAEPSVFRHYLSAADVGVQLRTLSRGETSGTVLDCMNHGLALIVNANGSMEDLSNDAVWKLPELFNDLDLVEALTILRENGDRRRHLGKQGQEIIQTKHSPRICGDQYHYAIENFDQINATSIHVLSNYILHFSNSSVNDASLITLANAIDQSIKPKLVPQTLFIDIYPFFDENLKPVNRINLRSALKRLLMTPSHYRIEPVCLDSTNLVYRYARKYTLELLDIPTENFNNEPVRFNTGDDFLCFSLLSDSAFIKNRFKTDFDNCNCFINYLVCKEINFINMVTAFLVLPSETEDPIINEYLCNNEVNSYMLEILNETTSLGDTIIDAGCHIGTFSIGAAALGRKVIAIDANPLHVDLILLSACVNGFSNFKAINKAISLSDKPVNFLPNGLFGAIDFSGSSKDSALTVETIKLDEVVKFFSHNERVVFLKMDIEGAEFDLLMTANYLLERDKPIIWWESNGPTLKNSRHTIFEMRTLLESKGYKTFRVEGAMWIYVSPTQIQPEAWVDMLSIHEVDQKKWANRISWEPWGYEQIISRCEFWLTMNYEHTLTHLAEEIEKSQLGEELKELSSKARKRLHDLRTSSNNAYT